MKCPSCNHTPCQCRPYPNVLMREHDRVKSRTTGREVEISMGMHGSGLVPKNLFASIAQRGYMHIHPEILGKEGLKEWDESSKGLSLLKHAHKSK